MSSSLNIDELTVKQITVTQPDSPVQILLTVTNGIAGIWIQRKTDGQTLDKVAIYSTSHETAVGVRGNHENLPYSAAISVDESGQPSFQFVKDDGAVVAFGFDDVQKLLAPKPSDVLPA